MRISDDERRWVRQRYGGTTVRVTANDRALVAEFGQRQTTEKAAKQAAEERKRRELEQKQREAMARNPAAVEPHVADRTEIGRNGIASELYDEPGKTELSAKQENLFLQTRPVSKMTIAQSEPEPVTTVDLLKPKYRTIQPSEDGTYRQPYEPKTTASSGGQEQDRFAGFDNMSIDEINAYILGEREKLEQERFAYGREVVRAKNYSIGETAYAQKAAEQAYAEFDTQHKAETDSLADLENYVVQRKATEQAQSIYDNLMPEDQELLQDVYEYWETLEQSDAVAVEQLHDDLWANSRFEELRVKLQRMDLLPEEVEEYNYYCLQWHLLNDRMNALNLEEAEAYAKSIAEERNPLVKLWKSTKLAFISGLKTGAQSVGDAFMMGTAAHKVASVDVTTAANAINIERVSQESKLGGIALQAVNSLGSAVPAVAAGLISPYAAVAVNALGSTGSSYSYAKQAGEDEFTACMFGLLSGGVDAALSMWGGARSWSPKGTDFSKKVSEKLTNVLMRTAKNQNVIKTVNVLVNYGMDSLQEGGEELIQSILAPTISQLVLSEENAKTVTSEEMWENALVGALTAAANNLPSTMADFGSIARDVVTRPIPQRVTDLALFERQAKLVGADGNGTADVASTVDKASQTQFLSPDGKQGTSINERTGEIGGWFSEPGKEAQTIQAALEQGGKWIADYDGERNQLYEQAGFVAVSRTRFEAKEAPEGWDTETAGTPNLVFWVHKDDVDAGTAEKTNVEALPEEETVEIAAAHCKDALTKQEKLKQNATEEKNGSDTTEALDNGTEDDIMNIGSVITDGSHMENGYVKPNVVYKTGEHDYLYRSDDRGRIVHVKAKELRLKKHTGRLPYVKMTLQKLLMDDAGHLIGDQFGGSGQRDNVLSQARSVNRGEYLEIERTWRKALNAGQTVELDIRIEYEGNSKRPSVFCVTYRINGVKTTEVLRN